MRVAPRHGLDDAGDFDCLTRIEDTRLTVMRVSMVPEHGETRNQAHDPEELSHAVVSCQARSDVSTSDLRAHAGAATSLLYGCARLRCSWICARSIAS